MKNIKRIKIFLLIILFLIVCSYTTKINAANGNVSINSNTTPDFILNAFNNDQNISFTYNDVVQNKYIYCRENSVTFNNHNFAYYFGRDSGLAQVTYPDAEGNRAGFAYLFAKNLNTYGNKAKQRTFGDSTLQQALWDVVGLNLYSWSNDAINMGVNAGDATTQPLIDEARGYETFIKSIGGSNSMSYGMDDDYFDFPEKLEEVENAKDPNTYGPIKIKTNSWIYNNVIKNGLTEFKVVGIDKNGNSFTPHFYLVINGKEYSMPVNGNTSDVSKYFNGKITKDNSLHMNTLIALNNNCKSKGFNICFKEEITGFYIEVNYHRITDVSTTFIPISATNGAVQKLLVVKPSINEDDIKIRSFLRNVERPGQEVIKLQLKKIGIYGNEESGAEFAVVARQKGVSDTLGISYDKSTGIYTINVAKDKRGQIIKETIFVNILEMIAPAGYETLNKSINLRLDYNESSKTFHPTFAPALEDTTVEQNGVTVTIPGWKKENSGFNQSTFGGWQWDRTGDSDWHFPNTYISSANDKIIVEKDNEADASEPYIIKVYDEPSPTISLKLEKYAIYELEQETKHEIDNFMFGLTAKQEGVTNPLLSMVVEYNNRDEINIVPQNHNRNPIEVEIEEIESPEGFKTLNKTIIIKYTYDEEEKIYVPTFTNDEWHADGSLENIYVSTANDIYQVKTLETYNLINVIQIYDNPAPIKFSLKKFNSFFNSDDNKRELTEGVSFTVRASQNWYGHAEEINGVEIKTKTASGNGMLANIDVNDVIEIIPNYVDEDHRIYISIEETAPAGYLGLSKPIVFQCAYNGHGKWNIGLVLKENDQDFTEAFGTNYPLWTWVVMNDADNSREDVLYKVDTSDIDRYDSNLSNVYCLYNGTDTGIDTNLYNSSNIPRVIRYQETVVPNKQDIKDIIEVNYEDGVYEFGIYNEHKPSNIRIELEKYGVNTSGGEPTKLNGRNFEFRVTAKQVGVADSIIENGSFTNLVYSMDVETGSENDIYVVIKETGTPYIYDGLKKPINIKYTYNNSNNTWEPSFTMNQSDFLNAGFTATDWGNWQNTSGQEYQSSEGDIIKIENDGIIDVYNTEKERIDINIIKEDVNYNLLDGAKFDISIANIKSLFFNGEYSEPYYGNTFEQNACSIKQLFLRNVEFDSDESIYITLKEVEAPEGYSLLNNGQNIYIEIPHTGLPKIVDAPNNTGNEIENEFVELALFDDETPVAVLIRLKNIKKYNISGKVWLDKETIINNKTYGRPDGIKNGKDELLEGIEVQLYSGTTLKATTYTDENGYYEFTNLDENRLGYYVKFIYDGMHYENDYYSTSSQAWEDNLERQAFNDRFYRIYENEARNYDEETNLEGIDSLVLSYQTNTSNGVSTSILNTKQGNQVKDEFKMSATTDVIKESATNIDLALKEREEADLALTVDLMNKNNIKVRDYMNTFFNGDRTKNLSNIITVDDKIYTICKIDIVNQGEVEMLVDGLTFYANGGFGDTTSEISFDMNKTLDMNNTLLRDGSNSDITYFGNYQSGMQIQWNGTKLYLPPKSSRSFYLLFEVPENLFNEHTEIPFKAVVDSVTYISPEGIIDKDSQPNNLNLDLTDYSGFFEDDSFKMEKTLRIN